MLTPKTGMVVDAPRPIDPTPVRGRIVGRDGECLFHPDCGYWLVQLDEHQADGARHLVTYHQPDLRPVTP